MALKSTRHREVWVVELADRGRWAPVTCYKHKANALRQLQYRRLYDKRRRFRLALYIRTEVTDD